MEEKLEQKIKQAPDAPGVYLFKDGQGRIIYVGKARSLKQRVRSYLAPAEDAPRLKALQSQARDIEYIVTDNEVEALILECNLIKENRPRYNVNLKDDKDYPYLLLTQETYPRLEYLRLSQIEGRRGRRKLPPGSYRLFGPYTSAGAVKETVKFLGKVFPLRRCRRPLDGTPSRERPCLNFQMKRCLAPCRGAEALSPEEYKELVEQVALFLQGQQGELEKVLKEKMKQAAKEQRFEEAALYRDQLQSLQQIREQQKVLSVSRKCDQDLLALARHEDEVAVHVFKIREGKLLSQDHFPLSGTQELTDEQILTAFIKNYYSRGTPIPPELILSASLEEEPLVREWLQKQAGRRVTLTVPRRGRRKQLLEMARRDGELLLREKKAVAGRRVEEPLKELAELAAPGRELERIEGYDISHLQGGQAVGVMVVFTRGLPDKGEYRQFLLRETPAGDDYAALQEVLLRRFSRTDWPSPDLLLIDGGRGQLNAAREALARTGHPELPLIALAKNPEQIFLEALEKPLLLPAHSPLLQLLQRIRDEAHRYAVACHRRRRQKEGLGSPLEKIPGIGPRRRAALLNHFGSLENLYRATEAEIRDVPGFNARLARHLHRQLHSAKGDA